MSYEGRWKSDAGRITLWLGRDPCGECRLGGVLLGGLHVGALRQVQLILLLRLTVFLCQHSISLMCSVNMC